MASGALLEVRGLSTHFHSSEGVFRAVDGVSFTVGRGEVVGIVGESGCGKSVTSLSIMRLVPSPPGEIAAGEILFEGVDLLAKSDAEMRRVRGKQISMIFQEPMTSLNPVYTIGDQIMEGLLQHERIGRAAARERAIEMLDLVRIPSPASRIDAFPHELSGGMRQRAMIAIALACEPKLLIADEPTTALDVTIQAQILELMADIRARTGTAMILVTHDLGVVAETVDKVVVMYAGDVVETAPTAALFDDAHHPYTLGLMTSIPRLDMAAVELTPIPGNVPNPYQIPEGCKFNPRCPFADARCRAERPPLQEVAPGHSAACWKLPIEAHVA